jgi:hypothetical protein
MDLDPGLLISAAHTEYKLKARWFTRLDEDNCFAVAAHPCAGQRLTDDQPAAVTVRAHARWNMDDVIADSVPVNRRHFGTRRRGQNAQFWLTPSARRALIAADERVTQGVPAGMHAKT